ncbi:hypothetical protein [Nocardioides speluncae]|uniref:hypothetical protein n=1 Tax=Nocardioides speluncae TaxID=2670337 RepID=UPI000D69E4A8|nr:hypothetical protein [Nocardioides speluncae]
MHSFPVRIAAAALVALSMTACGGSDESSDEPSTTPSDESTSAAPSDPASTTPPTKPPPSGSPSAGNPPPTEVTPMPPPETQPTDDPTVGKFKQRLSGVPTEGVESGCVVMTVGGETYQLSGLHRSHLGAKVVVEGVAQPDLMGTCMQGIPFQVTKVVSSEAADDPQ